MKKACVHLHRTHLTLFRERHYNSIINLKPILKFTSYINFYLFHSLCIDFNVLLKLENATMTVLILSNVFRRNEVYMTASTTTPHCKWMFSNFFSATDRHAVCITSLLFSLSYIPSVLISMKS